MNAQEIIEQYLAANGYDGLFFAEDGCACHRDNLAPCGTISPECEPGYESPRLPGEGEYDVHILRDKPKAQADEPACGKCANRREGAADRPMPYCAALQGRPVLLGNGISPQTCGKFTPQPAPAANERGAS